MKIINIQFNKKNISSNIKKGSLNWAISFLKKKKLKKVIILTMN